MDNIERGKQIISRIDEIDKEIDNLNIKVDIYMKEWIKLEKELSDLIEIKE